MRSLHTGENGYTLRMRTMRTGRLNRVYVAPYKIFSNFFRCCVTLITPTNQWPITLFFSARAGSCKATYYNVARGTIYSPRWPGRYQHNLSCSWRIFVPKKYLGKSNSLVFSFTYFDLEPVKDNLTIYTFESLVDTKPTKIVSLHGSEPQSDVEIPLKNAMYVFLQFDSDGQKAHYGFTITFKGKLCCLLHNFFHQWGSIMRKPFCKKSRANENSRVSIIALFYLHISKTTWQMKESFCEALLTSFKARNSFWIM